MNAFPERRWGFVVALGALVAVGCTELREHESPPLVFDDVNPILEESCVECHGATDPEAGYSVEDYWRTIRCIPDPEGQPATLPADETAPILAVFGPVGNRRSTYARAIHSLSRLKPAI